MAQIEKKFSWRAFLCFGLTYTFIAAVISGIVLYISPTGRHSCMGNWEFLWLAKGEWKTFHTYFSFAFIIFCLSHLLAVNWKTFCSYFKNRTSKGINRMRELVWASVVFAAVFYLIIFSI